MTVAWIRRGPETCTLRCAPRSGGGVELELGPERAVGDGRDFFYASELSGLAPGTRYDYTLSCPGGEHSAHFRTFPQDPASFSFICYGDNKGGHPTHRRIALLFQQHDPCFAMHSGDMTDHGGYEEYKPLFFDPISEVIDRIPLVPGRGNHEGDGVAYRQVFALPGGETWYSFDLGCAHFIVLDTVGRRHAAEQPDIPRMYEWLEHDLAAAAGAAWRIAMYHEPSFDLGWRKDDWGRQDFLPLMRRGRVDLTFSGHAHGYQRLRPMVARGENEGSPITHVISAGAGARIDANRELDESDFLAAQARCFNYVAVTVERERLTARVLSDRELLLDEFQLDKPGGEYAEAVLERALRAEDYP
jgi:hypothetical protein